MNLRFLSLFSGIEAASEAWTPLDWQCVGFSEIDKFACELLRQRHPGVPNLGDVSKITEDQIMMLGRVDAVVFGSPCQDLSVAGKRKGLDGARSGLFFDAMRVIGWLREWCDLRFALWENVPGAFTSNAGRDFAAVVDSLVGLEIGTTQVPDKKRWGNEGAAVGPNAMVEWVTLDAQWFGVAQRRRRVFALADFGDWSSRPPILLEPQSVRGDSAPRRRSQEDIAGTLEARAGGGSSWGISPDCLDRDGEGANGTAGERSGLGIDYELAYTLRAKRPGAVAQCRSVLTHEVVSSLDASFHRLQGCSGQDMNHGHSHLVVQAFGGNNQSGAIDVATALNASPTSSGRLDFESETFVVCATGDVTHPLNTANNGKGSSEDGTGRDIPTVAYMPHRTLQADGGSDEGFAEREVCDALHRSSGSGNKAPLIAFNSNAQPDQQTFDEHTSAPLTCGQYSAVAFQSSQSGVRLDDVHATLDSNNGSRRHNGAFDGMRVRRLTPTECERLQAFKDGHTAIRIGKKPAADGPRYKALGNSMAVVVMAWIGRQIDFVHRNY